MKRRDRSELRRREAEMHDLGANIAGRVLEKVLTEGSAVHMEKHPDGGSFSAEVTVRIRSVPS